MDIVKIPIDELTPDPNNAKDHPQWQIEQIKNSIEQFGNLDPIGVWGDDNLIVEGHGRYVALQELGYTEAECIRLDWLTEEERTAYALAHNKLTMNSGFIPEMLDVNLEAVGEIDMSQFGFEISEEEEPTKITEDDVPEEVETRCKLGDLWQMGGHRLICGDCTDTGVLDKLMNGQKADMVFTDPPYGYSYQSNMRTKSKKFDVIDNDDKILDFFPNILGRVDGFVFVCTTWKVLDVWLNLFESQYDLSNMIIWDKGGGGIGDLKKTFATDYEVILCANNGHEIKSKRVGSVWDIGKDSAGEYKHPTQKPVKLPAFAIEHTTDKNAYVLDVFGGSGSTLIACEQTDRKCFMCELDPHYCDVIIQRWETLTGRKAVLMNDAG